MIALAKLVASRQKTCAQYGLGKDSKKDSEGIPKGRNTTGLRDESQRDSGGIPGFQKIRELIVSSQFSKTKFTYLNCVGKAWSVQPISYAQYSSLDFRISRRRLPA